MLPPQLFNFLRNGNIMWLHWVVSPFVRGPFDSRNHLIPVQLIRGPIDLRPIGNEPCALEEPQKSERWWTYKSSHEPMWVLMSLCEFIWAYGYVLHKMSLVSQKSLKQVSAHEPMWILMSLCEFLWVYMSSYEPKCFIRWAFWVRRVSKKWAPMSLCEFLMSLCGFISLWEFSWSWSELVWASAEYWQNWGQN